MILDLSKIPTLDLDTGEPLSDTAKRNVAHMHHIIAMLRRGLEALEYDLANPKTHTENHLTGVVFTRLEDATYRTLETIAGMIGEFDLVEEAYARLPVEFDSKNPTGDSTARQPAH
jgi:hypothetical protein